MKCKGNGERIDETRVDWTRMEGMEGMERVELN